MAGLSAKIHKWLALLMALQILFWFVSGLFFAVFPIEEPKQTVIARKEDTENEELDRTTLPRLRRVRRGEFGCLQRAIRGGRCARVRGSGVLPHPPADRGCVLLAAPGRIHEAWPMEYGRSANLPNVLKRWLDGPRTYARVPPPPPLHRGALTVRHVLGVEDPAEYAKRAEEWARSAWEAWSEGHDQARAWLAEALEERGRAH